MTSARGFSHRIRVAKPEHVDWIVAVLLLAENELQVWLGHSIPHLPVTGLAVAFVAAAVAVRRRWPLASVSAVLAFMTARIVIGTPFDLSNAAGVIISVILLFYGLGAFAPVRRSAWMLALSVVVTSINAATKPGNGIAQIFPMELFAVLLPYAVGRALAVRRAREDVSKHAAEVLDSALVATARSAAYGERARIARELHDVIAHSVSVMVIQAGGARLVMDTEPDRAQDSLRSVERAGREALAELRGLLGLLGDEDPHVLAPQPGLGDIAPLLADARRSGINADLRVDGERVEVPPAVDLCAYRIVQESLTNAIKHAAPARASVTVRWGQETLELEIADDGRRARRRFARSAGGHGIIGMHERVALHSGTLEAGARPAGGFTVRASIPLNQREAA